MTPMVNSYSKDTGIEDSESWFQDARDNNFLAGEGHQINWWKGKGGFIDYTNPEALKWWQGLQQNVFNYGIDGWKLDGSATLFSSKIGPVPLPYMKTYKGINDHPGIYGPLLPSGVSAPDWNKTRSLSPSPVPWTGIFIPRDLLPLMLRPVNWVGDQEHHWTTETQTDGPEGQKKDIALKGIEGFESAIQSILKVQKLAIILLDRISPDSRGIRFLRGSIFAGHSFPPFVDYF